MSKVQNISKAIVFTPRLVPGSYFLCPDTDTGETGGLHMHITQSYREACDIVFGSPGGTKIRFDKEAARRMAAFMTELANVLE
jgi:hypothetical protein